LGGFIGLTFWLIRASHRQPGSAKLILLVAEYHVGVSDPATTSTPLSNLLSRFTRQQQPPAPLSLRKFRSKADFDQFYVDHGSSIHQGFLDEAALFTEQTPFTVKGFCYVCNRPSNFNVDFMIPREIMGKVVPAWRESVFCPRCNLSNRMRAAVHLVEGEAGLKQGDPLYLTESISPLFRTMKKRHQPTTGSEYLGEKVPFGTSNSQGVRNEDLTKLTYKTGEFAALMCFEVLEHVPDFRAAISELGRVLRPGGKLVMSAPFNPHIQDHSIRAKMHADGSIEHILEPEYHIDPLNPQGCLCFQHFGWAMLDDLRSAGFSEAYVGHYGSREYGYLGLDPLMFMATKGG
jgi:SAM-dependent methyltransferase